MWFGINVLRPTSLNFIGIEEKKRLPLFSFFHEFENISKFENSNPSIPADANSAGYFYSFIFPIALVSVYRSFAHRARVYWKLKFFKLLLPCSLTKGERTLFLGQSETSSSTATSYEVRWLPDYATKFWYYRDPTVTQICLDRIPSDSFSLGN